MRLTINIIVFILIKRHQLLIAETAPDKGFAMPMKRGGEVIVSVARAAYLCSLRLIRNVFFSTRF